MKSENTAETIGRLKGGRNTAFVVNADIELKKGAESKFIGWFWNLTARSRNSKGFSKRKLLKSADGWQLRVILTCTSRESFLVFYRSKEHMAAHRDALTFMSRPPQMSFYHVMS